MQVSLGPDMGKRQVGFSPRRLGQWPQLMYRPRDRYDSPLGLCDHPRRTVRILLWIGYGPPMEQSLDIPGHFPGGNPGFLAMWLRPGDVTYSAPGHIRCDSHGDRQRWA